MNDVVLAAAMIITYPVALVTMMKSHYVYEKHPNVITALFFPTKETVWEHTKLFFLPNILILFILNLIFRESYPNFQSVAGIVTITMSILPVILYPIMAKICDIKKEYEIYYSIGLTMVILLIGYIGMYLMALSDYPFYRYENATIIAVLTMLLIHAITTYFLSLITISSENQQIILKSPINFPTHYALYYEHQVNYIG